MNQAPFFYDCTRGGGLVGFSDRLDNDISMGNLIKTSEGNVDEIVT